MEDALTDLTFLCPPELAGHIPHPVPAADKMPDWFTALSEDMGGTDAQGRPGRTARACLPMTDACALGWIIPLPFDIAMSRDPQGQLMFHWADGVPFPPVQLLHPRQIGSGGPPFHDTLPLKFINPWRVILPEGWSAAFVQPLNHFDLPFQVFSGVVDCDVLEEPAKIPFLWTAQAETLVMPAGTPMVQVVPFKRDLAPAEADIRAETPAETAARTAAQDRSPKAMSPYALAWHARDTARLMAGRTSGDPK